jgi:hypothetical protein
VIETTVLAGVIAVRPIGPETVSNQSLLGSNRVSEETKRILKIGDQRLASEIGWLRWKIQKIKRQRLHDVSLTLGYVARIFGNRT